MIQEKKDAYTPNYILGTLIVAVFCIILLCGQSLWIPASRIGNLYIRAIVLSLTDAASAFASSTGLDGYLPAIRASFLSVSGLSENTAWDTRYFNRRDAQDHSTVTALAGESESSKTESASQAVVKNQPAGQALILSGSASAGPVTGSVSVARPSIERTPRFFVVHSRENPLRIYMFGDSQVFSLGSGLSQLAGKNSSVSIDFLAVHSSGFVRGDYYNWPSKLADTFRDGSWDGAIMMLGMNDYQSFWNNKGEIMKKGTPEWEAAYKDKCRSLIDIALASVPRLYWLGMPVVRNPVYNKDLAYIDSVQESLAKEYSPDVLVRISLSAIFPGTDKPYTDSLENGAGGKKLRVMKDDGTHYTVEGGQMIMKPLLDRFAKDYLFNEPPVANLP
jgi:hypothetical protein